MTPDTAVPALRLLAELPEADQRRILATARRRRFGRREVVFHEGDPGDTFHLIHDGRFAVRVSTPRGDVLTLAILGRGDFFGEMALLSAEPRTATVVALEPGETLSVHRDQFEELRANHRSFDRLLVSVLASQLRKTSAALLEALFLPADVRVLRRVLAAAAVWGDGAPGTVVRLTQDDLAELAGTTRPTVNRVLRDAERAGWVSLRRGQIVVHQPEPIARRAGMR